MLIKDDDDGGEESQIHGDIDEEKDQDRAGTSQKEGAGGLEFEEKAIVSSQPVIAKKYETPKS